MANEDSPAHVPVLPFTLKMGQLHTAHYLDGMSSNPSSPLRPFFEPLNDCWSYFKATPYYRNWAFSHPALERLIPKSTLWRFAFYGLHAGEYPHLYQAWRHMQPNRMGPLALRTANLLCSTLALLVYLVDFGCALAQSSLRAFPITFSQWTTGLSGIFPWLSVLSLFLSAAEIALKIRYLLALGPQKQRQKALDSTKQRMHFAHFNLTLPDNFPMEEHQEAQFEPAIWQLMHAFQTQFSALEIAYTTTPTNKTPTAYTLRATRDDTWPDQRGRLRIELLEGHVTHKPLTIDSLQAEIAQHIGLACGLILVALCILASLCLPLSAVYLQLVGAGSAFYFSMVSQIPFFHACWYSAIPHPIGSGLSLHQYFARERYAENLEIQYTRVAETACQLLQAGLGMALSLTIVYASWSLYSTLLIGLTLCSVAQMCAKLIEKQPHLPKPAPCTSWTLPLLHAERVESLSVTDETGILALAQTPPTNNQRRATGSLPLNNP